MKALKYISLLCIGMILSACYESRRDDKLLLESYKNNLSNVYGYAKEKIGTSRGLVLYTDYLTGVGGLTIALASKGERYSWEEVFVCDVFRNIQNEDFFVVNAKSKTPEYMMAKLALAEVERIIEPTILDGNYSCISERDVKLLKVKIRKLNSQK